MNTDFSVQVLTLPEPAGLVQILVLKTGGGVKWAQSNMSMLLLYFTLPQETCDKKRMRGNDSNLVYNV